MGCFSSRTAVISQKEESSNKVVIGQQKDITHESPAHSLAENMVNDQHPIEDKSVVLNYSHDNTKNENEILLKQTHAGVVESKSYLQKNKKTEPYPYLTAKNKAPDKIKKSHLSYKELSEKQKQTAGSSSSDLKNPESAFSSSKKPNKLGNSTISLAATKISKTVGEEKASASKYLSEQKKESWKDKVFPIFKKGKHALQKTASKEQMEKQTQKTSSKSVKVFEEDVMKENNENKRLLLEKNEITTSIYFQELIQDVVSQFHYENKS